MAEEKNPISERVKKMAAILQAAQKTAKEIEEEKAKEGQGGTAQPVPPTGQRPS